MTKNEYIASIILEAAYLLKEDSENIKKKDVDYVDRRNSYNIACQCISQIQSAISRSHIQTRPYSFDLFVKSRSDNVIVATVNDVDDDKSRVVRNIIHNSNGKMPNKYYLRAVDHRYLKNKISITIYLISEK